MKRKLREVADVQLGYQHREKLSHVEHGSHRLIQVRDIVRPDKSQTAAEWQVSTTGLDRVTPKGGAERYRLQAGDVLFVSRGPNNVAAPLIEGCIVPYPESWDDLVAAYTFYILRPHQDRILPDYLAWYINQPPAQAFLTAQARGTSVRMLPKTVFEELEVSVPPLAVQHQVMRLEAERAREEQLLSQLIAARRKLVQSACLKTVDQDPDHLPA